MTPRYPSPALVGFWQALLQSFDATVHVTGEIDDATCRATEEWQRGAGVEVTGLPDRPTWVAAGAALAYLATQRPEARPELGEGDRGRDVSYLQRRLNAHRHTVTINGVFDHRVRRAVAAFQAAAGLVPSGVVDSATWSVLD